MEDTRDPIKMDVVEKHIKEKARRAARQLIHEVGKRAAHDVDQRLRHLDPEPEDVELEAAPSTMCGRSDFSDEEFRRGLEEQFHKYFKMGQAAMNRDDPATAAFYFGKCLLLPVSEDLKLRQMVRHRLRQALAVRRRLQTAK